MLPTITLEYHCRLVGLGSLVACCWLLQRTSRRESLEPCCLRVWSLHQAGALLCCYIITKLRSRELFEDHDHHRGAQADREEKGRTWTLRQICFGREPLGCQQVVAPLAIPCRCIESMKDRKVVALLMVDVICRALPGYRGAEETKPASRALLPSHYHRVAPPCCCFHPSPE